MAIIERDVLWQGVDENGNTTIDFPITRLANIEYTSENKSSVATGDYIPIIDSADNFQMKKVPANQIGGGASVSEMAEIKARLKAVELAQGAEITSNQSALIFSTIDDVDITEGVWDEANAQMVF